MGRRRRKRFSSTKAWPVLVLLAGVFWAREFLGLSETESLSTQLEELSFSALSFVIIAIPVALIWLLIKTRQRMKERAAKKSEEKTNSR